MPKYLDYVENFLLLSLVFARKQRTSPLHHRLEPLLDVTQGKKKCPDLNQTEASELYPLGYPLSV